MRDSPYWKAKREIKKKYDHSSEVYDALYREEQDAKIRTALSALEDIQVEKLDLVLDIGCGTGLLFRHITERADLLVGLDMSRNLLRKASIKTSPKAVLILADADHMPFADRSFGTVFAVTLLQNMPDMNVTLQEINRVARGNAVIMATGLKKSFEKREFLTLLRKAGLQIVNAKADDRLLGYVAVSRKK
ncbi:MAG: methyltransferase domain-containing protein [Candidatus Bathyarchaeota archaeon]|nr:methyltransferase domain-containing protein [Candidatus Bathyarchaeota archaeon]